MKLYLHFPIHVHGMLLKHRDKFASTFILVYLCMCYFSHSLIGFILRERLGLSYKTREESPETVSASPNLLVIPVERTMFVTLKRE
jgi:hypothetical protein